MKSFIIPLFPSGEVTSETSNQSPNENFIAASVVCNNFLSERLLANKNEFEKISEKKGTQDGYIAIKGKNFYMIKIGMRVEYTYIFNRTAWKQPKFILRDDYHSTANCINEFITGPIYKRFLFDCAPIISLLQDNNDNYFAISSKYIEGFVTFSQYFSPKNTILKYNKIRGYERLAATILACGEHDTISSNLGLKPVTDANGEVAGVCCKIDGGWSSTENFSQAKDMWYFLYITLSERSYHEHLSLDAGILRKEIEQICLVSNLEIESIIRGRIAQLYNAKFSFTKMSFDYWIDNKTIVYDSKAENMLSTQINNASGMAYYFINSFYNRMKLLPEIVTVLKQVEVIEQVFQWKSGEWFNKLHGIMPDTWIDKVNKEHKMIEATKLQI